MTCNHTNTRTLYLQQRHGTKRRMIPALDWCLECLNTKVRVEIRKAIEAKEAT